MKRYYSKLIHLPTLSLALNAELAAKSSFQTSSCLQSN